MGDFNDLLSNEEKRSRVDHPPWRIRGFREAVQHSGLIDLHLIGYPFTWVKGRGGQDMKEERIDRAMATQAWCEVFHLHQLHNVVSHRSDHFPILLKLHEIPRRKVIKEFRFENAWLMEDDFADVVVEGWERSLDSDVLSRLGRCTEAMNEWGRKLRHKYRDAIDECREEMERLRGSMQNSQVSRYEEVRNKMGVLLAQEEAFWKQRSKVYWLKEGDTNSRFFHAMASTRRRRNNIMTMQMEEGEIVTAQQDICGVASNYFAKLFHSDANGTNATTEYIDPRVIEDDNGILLAPFNISEFKKVLFSMHSDKAPGPDGLNPAFFKRFWHLCGVEIFHAATNWLNNGVFPSQMKNTNIVLIPKKDNPKSMKDLRPISLCNVLYKIISKVLANRLKPLLQKCISHEQSAFVENRSIIDNVMAAH
jgi:hypothetical protein